MDLIFSGVLSIASMFYCDNEEFFKQAYKEMSQGAEWHYVGRQPLDPSAKSIPGRICNEGKCSEPYIMWKLKMPDND
jgi:hypothetical protein